MANSKKEIVIWQNNFFRRTMNIYEPRGPKYRCSQCNEVYNTRLSIFTHSKVHLKPFCVVCGLYTENLDQMQSHMKNIHRQLVDIIPIVPKIVKDENQNETPIKIPRQALPSGTPKKLKVVATGKKILNNISQQNKIEKQQLVSRFGRCINVKIPADY